MTYFRKILSRPIGVLFLAALLLAGAAFAGAQGRIIGRVTDGSGKPLEGVKVTITTKGLRSFKVELKTDKDGKYGMILNDSTLTYHYKFEKETYGTHEQDFKVPIGQTETLDIQLLTQQQAVSKGSVKEIVDPYATAYNAAVDALQAEDADGALAKAEEAIKANPAKAGGYDLATRAAFKKKAWDKAVEYGEKSLSIEPDNPALFAIMAESYKGKGDKAKASEYEKKYAAANPDSPEILYNQAAELYNKGDAKGAEPILRKVLEIKPEMASAHFLIGMCYVNLNKIPEMKKHLNEYVRLDPKGKDVGAAKEMLEAFK